MGVPVAHGAGRVPGGTRVASGVESGATPGLLFPMTPMTLMTPTHTCGVHERLPRRPAWES